MNNKAQPIEEEESSGFYAKHKKVYPREVHGLFATLRVLGVVTLLGLYYIVPWLTWDGHQAVLFDLPARRFYIFGLTFWPQDFFYLAVLLIIAALSLFYFTALAGRLWCGYACPQTVWTEVFLWIERKIEGDRNKQIKLDKSALNKNKFVKKALKHFVWITFSLWTGFTFVGYFTPITELGQSLLQLGLGPWEWFWVIFYSFATYGNAGWMREQVCIYMCPYARFQSAMFDKDTLIISYDDNRGEPRGARKKSDDPEAKGLGSCVDCTLCVQVCPTGIDIREGLQYQCIGCAACVDVCNEVMDKMGYQRDLIKYTTQNAIEGKKTKLLRPRIVIYTLILLAITAALIYSMATRIPLELDIIRDRNALYRTTSMGMIENIYTLKIANMDTKVHRYKLDMQNDFNAKLIMREDELVVQPGQSATFSARIEADPADVKQISQDIHFTLVAIDNDKLKVEETGVFIGSGIR
ncbi:MAG: cytochrome c oxidase accessory protein CcoG [Thioalkalispiraceae bacterium]|jgi:cytochrome c oxidase accessory protein FixG